MAEIQEIEDTNLGFGQTFNQSYTFLNNGVSYFIQFFITCADGFSIVIDSNMVVCFSYTNELNYLCLTGYLDVLDPLQEIGKLYSKPFCHLQVRFEKQLLTPAARDQDYASTEPPIIFQHTFIITNIEIKERKNNIISYRLHLISTMWYRLIGKVLYSSWDKFDSDGNLLADGSKTPTPYSMIRDMLTVGFESFNIQPKINLDNDFIDSKSFNTAIEKCPASPIKFASCQNTLMESINYLMNSQLQFNVKTANDFKLNFLMFDDLNQKYKVILLEDEQTFTETEDLIGFISDKGGMAEKLIYQGKIQMGSVVKKSALDMYESFFNRINWFFTKKNPDAFSTGDSSDESEFRLNELMKFFKPEDFGMTMDEITKMLINSDVNPKFNKEFQSHFETAFPQNEKNLNYDRLFTNVAVQGLYKEQFDNFVNQDSLVINISGRIARQPGQLFVLMSDTTTINMDPEKKSSSNKNEVDKNSNILGVFFVTKVQKIIRPAEPDTQNFSENIVLSRLSKSSVKKDGTISTNIENKNTSDAYDTVYSTLHSLDSTIETSD